MKATIRSFMITETSATKVVKKYVVIEKRRHMTPRTRYSVRFFLGWGSNEVHHGTKVGSLCEVAAEIREWLGLPAKPTIHKLPSHEELKHSVKMLDHYLTKYPETRSIEELKRQYIDPLTKRIKAVESKRGA